MATKATTLVEAMATFDPAPIEFEPGASPTFYVEREDRPLDLLRVRLLMGTGRGQKLLLAGHRGSGKSTELNRLCVDPDIQRCYEIVKFSVKDVLDVTDISHIDLLVSLVARTFRQLVDAPSPIELSERALKLLDGWRRRVRVDAAINPHFRIPAVPHLRLALGREILDVARLHLRSRSVGQAKAAAHLGANSVDLFLRRPLPRECRAPSRRPRSRLGPVAVFGASWGRSSPSWEAGYGWSTVRARPRARSSSRG
jgi:hypothetical protein